MKQRCKIIALITLICGLVLVLLPCDSAWMEFLITKRHLDAIQSQLKSIKNLLIEYKQKHGQYPINDQGLTELDAFASRFPYTLISEKALYDRDTSSLSLIERYSFDFFVEMQASGSWGNLERCIGRFQEEQGHIPQNQEEFISSLVEHLGLENLDGPWAANTGTSNGILKTEMAIDDQCRFYLMGRSSILTPWGLPYIYENRKGFSSAIFSGSPANRDLFGRYSIRVDDQVVVYSVIGQMYSRKLGKLLLINLFLLPTGIGIICLLISIGIQVWIKFKWGLLITFLLILLVLWISMIDRSTTGDYFYWTLENDNIVPYIERQKDLLQKYQENGVISKATYKNYCDDLDNRLGIY